MRRAASVLLLTWGLSACAREVPQVAESASHCAASEAVVFNCTVKSGKMVSVCGKEQRLEYCFGSAGERPEIALASGASGPVHAVLGFSGGGGEQLILGQGAVRYVVFNRILRTGDATAPDPRADAGVVVLQGDVVRSKATCMAPSDAQIDLPDGAQVAEDPGAYVYFD